MTPRLNPCRAGPELMRALVALTGRVEAAGLDKPLVELLKTRASQINGCAYCIRERAALAWAEAATRVAETHLPDAVYEAARQHVSEAEMVQLTLVVAVINAWNRVAIGFRSVHPGQAAA